MRNIVERALRIFAVAAPLVLTAATTSVAQSSQTAEQDWSRLIAASDLDALLVDDADVQVIDIRSEKYVKKGTIPGAVWVPFPAWRGPSERPGQPPTEAELEALLGESGLRLDQPIVIHNHSGKTVQMGRTAIVYWILKSAGAEEIAMLDGGFKAWRASDLPEAAAPSVLPPRIVDVTYTDDWWADPMDIFAITTGQMDGAILDARLDAQVRRSVEDNKPLMSMPMAQFIPASFFTTHMTPEGLTPSAQTEFITELEGRGITVGEEFLISVCQTGELSALSWFYASEIVGIENVHYYPDALQGWKSDGGLMFGLVASSSRQ